MIISISRHHFINLYKNLQWSRIHRGDKLIGLYGLVLTVLLAALRARSQKNRGVDFEILANTKSIFRRIIDRTTISAFYETRSSPTASSLLAIIQNYVIIKVHCFCYGADSEDEGLRYIIIKYNSLPLYIFSKNFVVMSILLVASVNWFWTNNRK